MLAKFWPSYSISVSNNAATLGNPSKGAVQRNRPNANIPNGNYRNIVLQRFAKTEDMVADENGKSWYWCPFHNNGKGLYVTHKPENHGLWAEQKKIQNASRGYNNAGSGHMPAGNTAPGSRLQMSGQMRAALATGDLSGLTAILESMDQQSNNQA